MRYPTIIVRGDILASWLTISDFSKSQMAVELGISRGRVSQLLSSNEEPSAHLMAKIMTLTHLPYDRLFRMIRTSNHNGSSVKRRLSRSLSKKHKTKSGVGRINEKVKVSK